MAVFHGRTVRTCAIRPNHCHDAGGGLSFYSRLQSVNRTTFGRGAVPSVDGDVRSSEGIALAAAYRIGRKEPLQALEVSGRCAVTLIQVPTSDPFRERRHSNLITHVVIADRRPDRMRAVSVVVTREWRIIAAGISNAVMDGVMPVVVVICCDSVPAAAMRLQRVVCPALTTVSIANCNSLASEPQRPDIRRVRVGDVRFNRLRRMWQRQAVSKRGRLRQQVLNVRIAFDSRDIRTCRQRFGDLAAALHQDRVHNVKGLMLDVAFTQPLKDRPCVTWLLFLSAS